MKAAGKGVGSDKRPQKEVPSSTYQLMPVGIVDSNELKSYAAELFPSRGSHLVVHAHLLGSSPPATSLPEPGRDPARTELLRVMSRQVV